MITLWIFKILTNELYKNYCKYDISFNDDKYKYFNINGIGKIEIMFYEYGWNEFDIGKKLKKIVHSSKYFW